MSEAVNDAQLKTPASVPAPMVRTASLMFKLPHQVFAVTRFHR